MKLSVILFTAILLTTSCTSISPKSDSQQFVQKDIATLKISENQQIVITSTASPTKSSLQPTQNISITETQGIVEPQSTKTPWPETLIRFAVIGDYGLAGEPLEAVAQLVNSWNPDFVITTGDNNYPAGGRKTIDENIGQYFHQYIFPYQGSYGEGAEINRFFPTLGNHDWIINDAQAYIDYFSLTGNERYYAFEWEFIHFFAVDSDWNEPDGNLPNSIQADWLKQSLEDSDAPWKIVFMHHPPYASGKRAPMLVMRWPFKEWGADVVIGGHDHHYERLIIDDFPYFVNGLGGAARYELGEIISGSQITYRANWGAMLVEVTPSEIDFQFINIDGEVIDSYSLRYE